MPGHHRAVEQRPKLQPNLGTVAVLANLVVNLLAFLVQLFSGYVRYPRH